MARTALLSVLGLSILLAGCETTTMGAGPAQPSAAPAAQAVFRLEDFAWSEGTGRNSVTGRLVYRQGQTRFTCAGASVILTPETPWSRERMMVLYRSDDRAAAPSDEVRARTPMAAPGGDYSAYIRRTACDASDRFAFTGVPNGAWYVITTARPAGQPDGVTVAIMRRVVTSAGKTINADL